MGWSRPSSQPALAGRDGAFLRLRHDHCVEAVQFGLLGHFMVERTGGIQHVLLELRAEAGELQHHRLEAILLRAVERHAGEAEIDQRVVHHGELLGIQLRGFVLAHRAVGAEQPFVLAEVGAVLRQQRQAGVVALAQCLVVHHAIEMADRRPGARQAVLQFFERLDQRAEAGRGQLGQFLDARAVVRQQFADAGFDMFGADVVEGGEGPAVQQGILVIHWSPHDNEARVPLSTAIRRVRGKLCPHERNC